MNMKIRPNIISAGGLLGVLAICPFTPASAIEPPPDAATPPAAMLRDRSRENPAATIGGKSAFLGIATVAVPGMVADHLGLTDGSGVIVRTVFPGSPAEKSGIAVNDIITALDGKPVVDPEALSSVIRNLRAGDSTEVALIHKGKAGTVKVTLGSTPGDATAQFESEPFLEGIPKVHADRLRGLIEENLQGLNPGRLGAFPDEEFENAFRQMRERMNREFGDQPDPAPRGNREGMGFSQNSTIRLMDGDGSVEISSSGGDTRVKVLGRDNKVIWSGPWNTDADKDAAPADVRERIDKVKSGSNSGFSFRFGNLGGAPGTVDN